MTAFTVLLAAQLVYSPADVWQLSSDGGRTPVPAKLMRDSNRHFRADSGTYHLELKDIEPGEYVLRLEMRETKRSLKNDPLGRRIGFASVIYREGRPVPFVRVGAPKDGWFAPETARLALKPGDVLTLAGLDVRTTGYDRWIRSLALAKEPSADAFETIVETSTLNDPSAVDFGKTSFKPGELKLDIRNRTGVKRPIRVEVEILDYWQKSLAKFDETRETTDAFVANVSFAPDGCDNYRAWIHVTDVKTGLLQRKILSCDADVLTGHRQSVLLDPLPWKYAWTADDGTYETRRMKDRPDAGVKWTMTTLPEGRIKANLVTGELVNQQWYRTSFVLPESMRGERTFITVGVSHLKTRIFVNGKLAGENELAYQCLPFEVEVTDLLKPGTNELFVAAWGFAANYLDEELKTLPKLIPARSLKGAFYSYHGQLSTVKLVTRPKTFIAKLPRVLTSVKDSTIEVLDEAPAGTVLRHRVLHKGREVVPPFSGKVKWKNPILWGPASCAGRHAPDAFRLLELESTLSDADGKVLDRLSQRFGFREFACEGPDFTWNGKPFRGVARCHVPEYGRYPWDKSKQGSLDWLERVAWLDNRFVGHAMGQNFFYDWSDELGLLICRNTSMMCVGDMTSQYRENPVFWENKKLNDLKAVDLYPNHPSLYVWYLSNEFGMAHNKYGADLMKPVLEAVDAKDPSRIAETGCDLDLWGASKIVSVHYPVYNAFREEATFLPDCFYWRPLDRRFTPGCKVPFGQSLRVCNVIGDSMITWGVKPIQAHETGWDHFMDFPHSPSQIWGEEAYNGPGMIQRMHADYNKWYIKAHRDAGCFHISPWRKYYESYPDYEMPPLDVVVIQKYHAFYEGEKVRYDVNVFHDVPAEEDLTFYWTLIGDGKTVASGEKAYHADWCRTFRETIAFVAPKAGSYMLRYGIRGKLDKARRIETYVRDAEVRDSRVITADRPLSADVVTRAEKGETIVVLARADYPDCLPVKLTTNQRNAAINFTFRPDHPALAGLTGHDLSFWYPKSCAGWDYFDKPASGAAKTLVEAGGTAGLSYAALVEVPVGKGTMFFTRLEMDADARAKNPIAARLLRNLLAYRRTDEGGRLGIALDKALVAKLRGHGVSLVELEASDLAKGGDLARFAALYVDGQKIGPEAVKAFRGRVFVRNPSAAWGVRTATNAVPLYAGRALKVQKRHPLLAGLTNFDFFFRKRAKTVNMYEHLTDPKCRLADVGDGQFVDGAAALIHPAYLAERGNLVFESLNWTAEPTPEVRDQTERIITTLLVNAGVKVVPPKREAARKKRLPQAKFDSKLCAKYVKEADTLKAAKKYAEAIELLKKAQSADARVLSVYNDIGETYEALGDFKNALWWYRKSLDFDFNQPPIIQRVRELEK